MDLLDIDTASLTTPSPLSVTPVPFETSPAPSEANRPLPTPSPDRVKCAICLGDLVNKSYSNTCVHQFCFGCLLEWSKVKPECPLCKSNFRSIYHNIRSNADFDEYVVPTPTPTIPSLSIRVSSRSDRSPELLISRGNHHDYSLPNYYHRAAAILRDPRVFRFQLAPFGSHRNDSIDVMVGPGHGHSNHQAYQLPVPTQSENPFHDEAQEFFGGILDLATRTRTPYHHSTRFSGYQSRRRRYDRNEWVRPFDSTLVPGTVFFPSVEYFQRHPAAMRKVTPWLHRELTVLMSLSSSRNQMAFAYDLVLSLLLRYDIRSSDFRDLLRPYMGTKTRHFQHEFYHFVLSGMRMEAFDNVAQYTSTSGASSSSTRPGENPYNAQPAVVTIDSDDDDLPEIVIDDADDSHAIRTPSSRSHSRHSTTRAQESGSRRSDNAGSSSSRAPDIGFPPMDISDSIRPLAGSEIDRAFNEIDIELERLINERSRRASRGASTSFDPEMPVLEPQVNLNNLSSSGYSGSAPSAFRRVRETDSSSTTPPQLLDFINLNDTELTNLFEERPGRTFLDPADGRRSPYPQIADYHNPVMDLLDFGAPSEDRPLGSPDFPILTLRENRERRNRQQAEADHVHRSSSSRWTPVALERPTCIHNNSDTGSSVQIRIFPPAMDLSSPLGLNLSSRTDGAQLRPRTPGRPPSPRTRTPDGECEFLGVHPIIKKPPLAVITLSSEDESDNRCAESIPKAGPSVSASGTYEPIPSTSIGWTSVPCLPPKRRYVLPSVEVDHFRLALSSLPPANLVERHMDSIHPLRLHTSKPTTKKNRRESETDETCKSRKSSTKVKTHKPSGTAKSAEENKKTIKTRTRPTGKNWEVLMKKYSTSASFVLSTDSDINLNSSSSDSDGDADYSLQTKRKRTKKVKKSKKSSRTSRSKSSRNEKSMKVLKSKRKRTPKVEPEQVPSNTYSTSKPGPAPSCSRPKSVVIKFSKKTVKGKSKKYKSKAIISSSESSDSDEIPTPTPRIRSVISNANGSLTATSSSSPRTTLGDTGSSQSQDIHTPALDLTTNHMSNTSPFVIERMSMSSSFNPKKLSRRWESDDDEDDNNSRNPGNSESGSLLSVGFDEERLPDSDESDDAVTSAPTNCKRLRLNDDDDDCY